jgi:hypothetical protein
VKKRQLLWLFVPCIGLAELGAHEFFKTRAPKQHDWQELRPKLAGLRKANELVVVAPDWGSPLARQAFGDQLMPLSQVARPDVTAFVRAIEVSMLGQRAPELAGWRIVEEHEHGKFALRVLINPAPAKVSFDFVDALGPERVGVHEGTVPCRWNDNARPIAGGLVGNPTFPKRRFECPSGPPHLVAVTVIDDDNYRPRRCVWAPPSTQSPIVLRYRGVPLGDRIRGYVGVPWLLGRDGVSGSVTLEARALGKSLGKVVQRGDSAWALFELPTGHFAGTTTDVEFVVHESHARDRHFCFYADTRWSAPS